MIVFTCSVHSSLVQGQEGGGVAAATAGGGDVAASTGGSAASDGVAAQAAGLAAVGRNQAGNNGVAGVAGGQATPGGGATGANGGRLRSRLPYNGNSAQQGIQRNNQGPNSGPLSGDRMNGGQSPNAPAMRPTGSNTGGRVNSGSPTAANNPPGFNGTTPFGAGQGTAAGGSANGAIAGPSPTTANNPQGFTGTPPFSTGQATNSPAGGVGSAGDNRSVHNGAGNVAAANNGSELNAAATANRGGDLSATGSLNANNSLGGTAAGGNAANPLQRQGALGTGQPGMSSDDRTAPWRFTQHNGEWWYYGANNAWQYHRNGVWNPYAQPDPAGGLGETGPPAARNNGVRVNADPYETQPAQPTGTQPGPIALPQPAASSDPIKY